MIIEDLISQVAEDLQIPSTRVKKIYLAYWKQIRELLQLLPLRDIDTKEEFDKLRPNINVVRLGKFYIDYLKYKAIKDDYKRRHKDD